MTAMKVAGLALIYAAGGYAANAIIDHLSNAVFAIGFFVAGVALYIHQEPAA